MHQGIIEHTIAGRMRLRFREERRNTSFFQGLARELEQLPVVSRVVANPLTGSVLIFHSGSATEIAARAGAVSGETGSEERHGVARRMPDRYLQSQIPDVKVLALLGLSILQLARGRVASNAMNQFWYAEQAASVGQSALAIGMAGLGLAQLFRGRWLGSAASLLMYTRMAETSRKVHRHHPLRMQLQGMPFARLRSALPRIRSRLG